MSTKDALMVCESTDAVRARLERENARLRDSLTRTAAERDFLLERLTSMERLANELAAYVANPERVS